MSVVRQNDRGFGVGDCSSFLQGLLGGAPKDCWIQFYERISNLKGFVYLDVDHNMLYQLGSVALFDGRFGFARQRDGNRLLRCLLGAGVSEPGVVNSAQRRCKRFGDQAQIIQGQLGVIELPTCDAILNGALDHRVKFLVIFGALGAHARLAAIC